MDDRYKKVEGLLFSYKSLPYRKKCLEIDLEIESGNESKAEELKKINLIISKIENMLEMIKNDSEIDYLILKLWYIDKLSWEQISSQLNMSVSWLIAKRKEIIISKLISVV